MEKLEIASAVFATFLDQLVLENIDLFTLEIIKDDWIDLHLNEYRSDILYRTKLKDQNNFIYFLFEHKSYSDETTPYQIFRYMGRIWNEFKNQNSSIKKLPVVVPIIFYHGSHRWKISNSIKPQFAIIEGTSQYVPDFESLVIDLFQISENIIDKIDQIELQAFLLSLKFSRDLEIWRILPKIIGLFNNKYDRHLE